MNGIESNKVNQSIVKNFKSILKDNLFAVVSVGSVAWGNFKESWSDVDILIVVDDIDLVTKQRIA
jgi:predicted nucleotidyltransferase